jgi:predicted nucleic acid-binding protein
LIILDTSALFAFFRSGDPDNEAVTGVLLTKEPLIVSPFVIAELDYLVEARAGVRAELQMLADIASGAYELPVLSAADLIACAGVIDKYADQRVGVTDASLVVLAERYQTRRICTLDHRNFGVMRGTDGTPFELLP